MTKQGMGDMRIQQGSAVCEYRDEKLPGDSKTTSNPNRGQICEQQNATGGNVGRLHVVVQQPAGLNCANTTVRWAQKSSKSELHVLRMPFSRSQASGMRDDGTTSSSETDRFALEKSFPPNASKLSHATPCRSETFRDD